MANRETMEQRRKVAGVVAIACALTQVVFQLVIACGAPVGKAAWGGSSAEVSTGLRVASGVASVTYVFFASILLQAAGLRDMGYSKKFCRGFTWFLTGLMSIGSVMNWISPSPLERYIWGPFTLVFAGSSLVLARSQKPRINEEGSGPAEDDRLVGDAWAG